MIVLIVGWALAQDSEREIVNRRAEARGAYLANPESLYRHYCSHCHGDDATGSGRLWATELPVKPADLTRSRLDAQALERFILEGSAASGKSNLCPPWKRTLAAPDAKRLARHLVALRGEAAVSPTAPSAPPAENRRPFPWAISAVILAEIALLAWMLRRREEPPDVVPQDPPVCR
ncbi:MAG: cytochrome c [Planctomycetes bacterium]|nr:cytochrome c [Planctomycetota bacterium]